MTLYDYHISPMHKTCKGMYATRDNPSLASHITTDSVLSMFRTIHCPYNPYCVSCAAYALLSMLDRMGTPKPPAPPHPHRGKGGLYTQGLTLKYSQGRQQKYYYDTHLVTKSSTNLWQRGRGFWVYALPLIGTLYDLTVPPRQNLNYTSAWFYFRPV